ncbi:MAG: hypothetical protein CVU56_07880 [Deltaproteobacteria bacterium HGW-Deltaproteobacteria-14]|jgi:hypothetical protein|nr:MAG: hypothetical protein CVU56_07880 [Deltaproteobacteria bacterium HGW-Deltaproteobacteria-14]
MSLRSWLPGALALSVTIGTVAASALAAEAAPKPKPKQLQYDLDILGFNDGEPYRLQGAEAEAVVGDPGAEIWQFQNDNWMLKNQPGAFTKLSDVVGRFPERAPTDLIAVFQVDLDGDRTAEMLLVPDDVLNDGKHRYGPTLLKLTKEGYHAIWAATELPGERFGVVDIRDLNDDSRPEILVTGESGKTGFYQFMELLGQGKKGFASLPVDHVDSLHYVDLDRNGQVEVVRRQRVGRRGPAYQWTYVDHLYRWDGARFVAADQAFPRYHDEQTLPTLLGDLIDHYSAQAPILEEKVTAIEDVRRQVLSWTKRPRGFYQKKVNALRELQKKSLAPARAKLEALDKAYPYDVQVLIGLAQVLAAEGEWEKVLDAAIRALTIEPRNRQGWWWLGVAFSQLSERSSAVASMFSAVSLCGAKDEGLAFLKARRGEPGMEAALQDAIDQAMKELEAH